MGRARGWSPCGVRTTRFRSSGIHSTIGSRRDGRLFSTSSIAATLVIGLAMEASRKMLSCAMGLWRAMSWWP